MIRTHHLFGAVVLPVALLTGVAAIAKLPPPSDEAKAKASEAAAKTAWSGKVGAYQLCKTQDRLSTAYLSSAKTGAGAASHSGMTAASATASGWKAEAMPMGSPTPTAMPTASSASAAAAAPVVTALAGMPPLSTAATAKPVAMPACTDPGAFVYNAEITAPPLEAAGAHSPAKTATAPPSGLATSAEQNPAPKTK
ncbi:MAG: hypothetical protein ABIN96_00260 [Rubrivivax sp.]